MNRGHRLKEKGEKTYVRVYALLDEHLLQSPNLRKLSSRWILGFFLTRPSFRACILGGRRILSDGCMELYVSACRSCQRL